MADISNHRGAFGGKLIHSNLCLVVVPAGLCAAAVCIRWAMSFF